MRCLAFHGISKLGSPEGEGGEADISVKNYNNRNYDHNILLVLASARKIRDFFMFLG